MCALHQKSLFDLANVANSAKRTSKILTFVTFQLPKFFRIPRISDVMAKF